MSVLVRVERPCASAVRARNDGAKPTLTRANVPFFKNTRREIMSVASTGMSTPLKFRCAERERHHLRCARRLLDRRASCLRRVAAEHRLDQAATPDWRLATLDNYSIQFVARELQR